MVINLFLIFVFVVIYRGFVRVFVMFFQILFYIFREIKMKTFLVSFP